MLLETSLMGPKNYPSGPNLGDNMNDACAICNTPFMDDSSDGNDENWGGYTCEICGEDVCDGCDLWVEYENGGEHLKKYFDALNINPKDCHTCISCIEKAEIEIIEKATPDKLPLFINTEWQTEKGTLAYKAALAGTETLT
jgi:hypothetical protein